LNLGSLADYLGVPTLHDVDSATWGNRTLDIMPFAAFLKIHEDYYRDRNYVADTTLLPLASGTMTGPDIQEIFSTRYRAWEHDYFTSASVSTQRGTEVLMPLLGTGNVTYLTNSILLDTQDPGVGSPGNLVIPGSGGGEIQSTGDAGRSLQLQNIDDVTITNSEVSINDLRRAVRLQEWLERNQLAGSRYNESILAHFGRKTSDARLQRAEYLGGGKAVIQISEINTTAYSEDDASEVVPPGNPAGRGSAYANTNSFKYNCEEHGFVLGILSVMPSSAYMQGLPRMFQNRNTFLEYPWPTFANLGEQEVYDNEIYLTTTSLPIVRANQPVFGYQSRYADWKFIHNSSHGDFRDSLDFWHLSRKFSAQPDLDNPFILFEDTLQDRIFNVSGVDTLWMYVYNKIHVKRSLPYFGTPQL